MIKNFEKALYKEENIRKTMLRCTMKLFLNVSHIFVNSETKFFTFFQATHYVASNMVTCSLKSASLPLHPWKKPLRTSVESGQNHLLFSCQWGNGLFILESQDLMLHEGYGAVRRDRKIRGGKMSASGKNYQHMMVNAYKDTWHFLSIFYFAWCKSIFLPF